MDTKVLLALIALVVIAGTVFSASMVLYPDAINQPVLSNQSVAYYLKVLNKNIVNPVLTPAVDPYALPIAKAANPMVMTTKADDTQITKCPITPSAACVTDNVTIVDGIYRVTFNFKDKKELIGKNFKLDFSKSVMDYSKGSRPNPINHSIYSFTLSGLMNNDNYLLFKVNKTGGVQLNCSNLTSWNTMKSAYSTWRDLILSGDITTIVETVAGPAVIPGGGAAIVGSSPYLLKGNSLLLFNSSAPVTQDCFDPTLPDNVTFFTTATFRMDLLKEVITSNQMVLDFKVKLLDNAANKTYTDYPQAS